MFPSNRAASCSWLSYPYCTVIISRVVRVRTPAITSTVAIRIWNVLCSLSSWSNLKWWGSGEVVEDSEVNHVTSLTRLTSNSNKNKWHKIILNLEKVLLYSVERKVQGPHQWAIHRRGRVGCGVVGLQSRAWSPGDPEGTGRSFACSHLALARALCG